MNTRSYATLRLAAWQRLAGGYDLTVKAARLPAYRAAAIWHFCDTFGQFVWQYLDSKPSRSRLDLNQEAPSSTRRVILRWVRREIP